MNINATLLGQMITFGVFIGFTMKFVWPPLTQALAQRQKRIADGLAQAERGKHELELAQQKSLERLRNAKHEATKIIEQAQTKASHMIEEAKEKARNEGTIIKNAVNADLQQQATLVKDQLRRETAQIAMLGVEKILEQQLNPDLHQALLNKMIDEI